MTNVITAKTIQCPPVRALQFAAHLLDSPKLSASGCDVWTLARIAGHSSISISASYVHPSEDAVLTAMARLGGHNSGHSVESLSLEKSSAVLLTA